MRNEPNATPTVGKWIAETFQEKHRLETLLGIQPTTQLTRDDIKTLVASLRDITVTLAQDPLEKSAVYAELASPSPTTTTAGPSSSPGLA